MKMMRKWENKEEHCYDIPKNYNGYVEATFVF